MTILELLEWGNNKLKQEQIETSMLDAEILLAHILKLPRSKLFTGLSDKIDVKRTDKYRELIKRRLRREPVSTIIGYKPFYKRDFIVNRFVLTPRPDTEILVEEALVISKQLKDSTWFIDIGTGSGAIAITLAKETGLPVIATDISQEAITVAKQNADKHQVNDLIDFKKGETLEPLIKMFKAMEKAEQPLPANLIICANLPYLSTKQWSKTEPEVQDWEPKTALEAGTDGLDAYWVLFRQLSQYITTLPENITVLVEIDPSQAKAIQALILHHFSGAQIKIKKDLSGKDRTVIVQLK